MANIRSSKKDIRRSSKRRLVNQGVKSALKTYIKKAKAAADPAATVQAVKALDKAVQRGIIHKNQAARRKSRLAKAVNAAAKA